MTALEEPKSSAVSRLEKAFVFNLPALGAILIWSGTAPFSKYALTQFSVLAYTAIRPVVGTLILLGFLLWRKQSIRVERVDILRLVVIGVVGIGVSQVSYAAALSKTSVAHTVIIASMSPLFVAAYRLGVKRQSLPGRSLLGMLGGFLGVVILIAGAGHSSKTSIAGDFLALVSAVAWMGGTMWPAPMIKKYGSMKANLWMFGSTLLVTVPIGLRSLPGVVSDPPSLLAWSSVAYAALFGMVIGNLLWQRAVQEVGGARTLVYLYLQPVGAMLLAALFLGERLSLIQAVGGILALAGVSLVRKD